MKGNCLPVTIKLVLHREKPWRQQSVLTGAGRRTRQTRGQDATVQAVPLPSQKANEEDDVILLTSTSRRILTVAPDAMMG